MNSCLITLLLTVALGCGTSSKSLDDGTNELPIVSITSPVNNQNKNQNTEVVFEGVARDAEDGDLSHQIVWQSDIDGYLGTGAEIRAFLTEGNHRITAVIEDSSLESSEDNINLTLIQAYGVAILSWAPPTQNTDNSELLDLAGFNIYYGQSSTNMNEFIQIPSTTTRNFIFEDLNISSTYYFSITAYNTMGIESTQSEIVSKFIEE